MTRNIWTNFCSPILRSLHMKFEFNWPCGFRGEDVWKCWRTTDDGRRSHWYTNSSPRSLRLRWAKKKKEKKKKKRKKKKKKNASRAKNLGVRSRAIEALLLFPFRFVCFVCFSLFSSFFFGGGGRGWGWGRGYIVDSRSFPMQQNPEHCFLYPKYERGQRSGNDTNKFHTWPRIPMGK